MPNPPVKLKFIYGLIFRGVFMVEIIVESVSQTFPSSHEMHRKQNQSNQWGNCSGGELVALADIFGTHAFNPLLHELLPTIRYLF